MKSNNTFGVHFVLRTQKADTDCKIPVYARITVNGTRCEVSMKYHIYKNDWNIGKGEAKPIRHSIDLVSYFTQVCS